MIALLTTVFVASLIGSVHCAGMCGPFVAVAVGNLQQRGHAAQQLAYHGARLLTYSLLGAAAGALGAVLDLGGAMAGVQRLAAVAAGALMIAIGVITALRYFGVHFAPAKLPGWAQAGLAAGHRAAARLTPVKRAAAIGLLTVLLPCGWLYAFVITAAGTGSPLSGAATMAAFWAGTTPLLALLGLGAQGALRVLGPRLPLVTSAALVALGILTVAHRAHVPAYAQPATPPACISDAAAHAAGLKSDEMPCCKEHGQ